MTDLVKAPSKSEALLDPSALFPEIRRRAPDHAAVLSDVKEPTRISASTLMAVEKCMLAAFLARQTGDPSGEPAIFGNHFHDITAQVGFQAQLLHKETFSPDEVERTAMRVFESPELTERDGISDLAPLSREHMQEVIEMARSWALTAYFPVNADRMDIEVSVRSELAGQIISGRIDLRAIEGTTAIIEDYKTGRRVPTQAEVEKHPQLPTYAWHTLREYPQIQTFVLRERYVRFGVVREIVLNVEDVLRHEVWLRTTALRLRAAWNVRGFKPTPGKHCKYCPNAAACPLPEWARPESIESQAQAEAQLAAILVEEARLKTRKTALRAFLERDDAPERVSAGDADAYLNVTYPKRLNKKAAVAAGINLEPYETEGTSTSLKVEGT